MTTTRPRPSRDPDPTPDEIRAACLAIQAGWSERRRAALEGASGLCSGPWVAPGAGGNGLELSTGGVPTGTEPSNEEAEVAEFARRRWLRGPC